MEVIVFHGLLKKLMIYQDVNNMSNDVEIYKVNSEAPVGSMIKCPECHTTFIKKTYNHKFCCTACKDKYHNRVNPERANRQRKFWERVKEENSKITDKYKNYE